MNLLDTIKKSLIMLFLQLPIILIVVVFFLGGGLGNAGLLWLSSGQLLLVPIAVMALHFVTQFGGSLVEVPYSDIGQLVPSEPLTESTARINVFPSYWMAHFAFFSSYILSNAYAVYKLEPVSDEPEYVSKIKARKARTINIMIFTLLCFVILSGIRLRYTHSEKFLGVLFATAAFGGLGYGWYVLSNTLGIRTMDIFGVAQQMVTTYDPTKPVTCVNTT